MEIDFHNQQSALAVDEARLRSAIENVLAEGGFRAGEVSVAIIDDAHMKRLNAQYLNHDWPTDVLSFVHESSAEHLEGEIIVSADTAKRQAAQFDWTGDDELLLYVIHGALHLIGYDDHADEDRAAMREAERFHLAKFGLAPNDAEEAR